MDNLSNASARLIDKALNLSTSPSSDGEYGALLRLYRSKPEMQELLADIASGMNLMVLDVSERGMFLAPTSKESRFSLRLGDLKAGLKEDQKVALVLTFLGICAQFYPTTVMIEDDSHFAMPASLKKFVDRLDSLAERLHAMQDSDEYSREELRPGWSYIHSLPRSIPERKSALPSSIEGLVRMALKYMIEYGLVNTVGSQDEEEVFEYTPTHRLRIQLRERTLPQLFEFVRTCSNDEAN